MSNNSTTAEFAKMSAPYPVITTIASQTGGVGDWIPWDITLSIFVFLLLGCLLLCVCICYRDQTDHREMSELRAEIARREKIRHAVRAKIAEIEGHDSMMSVRWYMEQRDPTVQWGDVQMISPEASTHQSVSVLYHSAHSTDPAQLKRIDVTLQDLNLET